MNLPDVIEHFASPDEYTVRRGGTDSWVDGKRTAGSVVTLAIRAAIQPLSGRDLVELPEGHHVDEVRLLFTATALRALTPATPADVVVIDGEDWRVVELSTWTFDGGTHYRALVSRRPA